MQPTYMGLMRLLIAELPRFPRLGSLFAKEQVSQEVTLFFYYHKRMDTSHLEIVWPVNS